MRTPIDFILNDPVGWINNKRFKPIGEGAFACAYLDTESKLVIKTYKQDDAYDEYLDLIEKRNNSNKTLNPYLPKIYERIELDFGYRIKSKNGKWVRTSDKENVVIMEHLHGITKKITADVRMTYNFITYLHCLNTLNMEDIGFINTKSLKKIIGNNENLLEIAKILRKLQQTFDDACLDLHDNNFMLRKRGRGYQLVLTDPAAA